MSKKDVSTDICLKDFWSDNAHFADLANAVIFDGSPMISLESLHELDTDVSGIIAFRDYEISLARLRDVVKKTAYGIDFVILSVENQQNIHYAMPLRTMLYDGLGYLREYQEISRTYKNMDDKNTKDESEEAVEETTEETAKENEVGTEERLSRTAGKVSREETKGKKIKLEKDEFLSKFRKNDRLHPIITIVVSYNENPWDGPLTLRDMMVEMSPDMDRFFSDYRMNLVEVRDSAQLIFHNEDVKDVFDICREIFHDNLDVVRKNYKDKEISIEAAAAIQSITNTSSLCEISTKGAANMNMCTALEKLKNEGRDEGINESIIKLINKGFSEKAVADMLDVTVERIVEVRHISSNI
ncbi:MAG: hypothetical protein LUF92_16805 [Clostridiales bacterium]|nr:hypothetical protein [Clostridiales bacterium]